MWVQDVSPMKKIYDEEELSGILRWKSTLPPSLKTNTYSIRFKLIRHRCNKQRDRIIRLQGQYSYFLASFAGRGVIFFSSSRKLVADWKEKGPTQHLTKVGTHWRSTGIWKPLIGKWISYMLARTRSPPGDLLPDVGLIHQSTTT